MGPAATTEAPWAATWLRDLRVAAGQTQEELAERAGIGVRSVRDLERGVVKRPRRETLRLIASALDLDAAAAEKLNAAFRNAGGAVPAPLAATESAGRSHLQRVPAELPRDVPRFIGRTEELHTLGRYLNQQPAQSLDSPPVVVISGAGGFGKSTLGIHAAHQLGDSYPDGQIFINLGGPRADSLTSDQAQFEILWALGTPDADVPRSQDARTRYLHTLTASTRLLVVLDDAADATHVDCLLPSGPGNAVIITSRSALTDLDATAHLTVGPFAREDSVALLADSAGTASAGTGSADTASADIGSADTGSAGTGSTGDGNDDAPWSRLAALCGDSPLALRISAARLKSRSDWAATDMIDRLEQEQTRLSFLDYGVLGVRSCLNVSLQALRTDTARDRLARSLFARLARLPGRDFAVEAVAAVAGRPLIEVEAAIDRLLDVQLLQSRAPDRVSYHDLTLLYARELPLPDEGAQDFARLGAYYATHAREVAGLFGNSSQDESMPQGLAEIPRTQRDIFDWFRDEVSGISEYVTARASSSEQEYLLCRLIVQSIWVLLEHTKRSNIRDNAVEAVCAAAKTYRDPFTRIWCERQLSFAYANAGSLERARTHLGNAEAILPELSGDPETLARAEGGLLSLRGILHGMGGDLEAAIGDLRTALRRLSPFQLAHRAHCLENLAYALVEAGRPREALRYHLRLLAAASTAGNANGQILATQGIAEELAAMDKPTQAIRQAQQALALAEEARVPRRIFDALELVAQQSYAADLPEQAAAAHERAMAVVNTQAPAARWSPDRWAAEVNAARAEYVARHPERSDLAPTPALPSQRAR